MKRPDVREGLDRAGFDDRSSTPEELGAFLKEQLKCGARSPTTPG
jgi:hypothetical protein